MSPGTTTRRAFRPVGVARVATTVAAALSLSLVLGGCFGTIGKVVNAARAAVSAASNLKSLESQIQKGENASFEATYKSTGSGQTASTFILAQEPGGKYAYIAPGAAGSSGSEFFANGKNQYECSQDTSGGKWSCIETAEAAGGTVDADPFYAFTGAYAYTIMEGLDVAAAFEGYHVTNSSTSLNGIAVKCVGFSGKSNGVTESYKWCVTKDGILGLSQTKSSNASDNSSFEITKLNTSPASSLFQPPSGATITSESA